MKSIHAPTSVKPPPLGKKKLSFPSFPNLSFKTKVKIFENIEVKFRIRIHYFIGTEIPDSVKYIILLKFKSPKFPLAPLSKTTAPVFKESHGHRIVI